MRIGFISRSGLQAFKEECEKQTTRADVLVFGFWERKEVDYERELKEETNFFEDAALLSKKVSGVVVCGCITNARGHKRKSAVVAEEGRLCGVSDMMNVVDGEVGSGAALRIYDTKAGRMGVVVAEDLHFPGAVKSLVVCGSDFIVCPFGRADTVQSVLLRANAYCYGVPIFFCGEGYAMVADASGDIAFATPQSPAYFEFENKREYHLVETRKRGFFKSSL